MLVDGVVVQPCLDCGCMFLGMGIGGDGGVGEVTCPKARVYPRSCGHVWDGHQCYWTDKPDSDGLRHRRVKHACACGKRWDGGDMFRVESW